MIQEQNFDKLEERQKRLLKTKLQFMQYWTTLFFHEEHRAVMAYLCHRKISGVDKVTSQTEAPFWKTKNIDNIIAELKSGFMADFEIKRVQREEVKYAWVNLQFFANYSNLQRVIIETIKPEMQEVKKYEQSEVRKKCQQCGQIRTESELQFLKEGACECNNPCFKIMELKKSKKDRIEKIHKMLEDYLFKKAKLIDEDERELIESRRRNKETEYVKIDPFDEICMRFGCEKIKPQIIMIADNVEREKATNRYGRKAKVGFHEDLKRIREDREKRKREREENGMFMKIQQK